LVEGSVAEHGVEGVAASSGQFYQGLVASFSFGAFPVVVGPAGRSLSEAKAERNRTRLSALLPLREAWSPRMEDPERQVTGERPA